MGLIRSNINNIKKYANVIKKRLSDDFMVEDIINDNLNYYHKALENSIKYILIDDKYNIDINLLKGE